MGLDEYFDDINDDIIEFVDLLDEVLIMADKLPPEFLKNKAMKAIIKKIEKASQGLEDWLGIDECEDECEEEEQ